MEAWEEGGRLPAGTRVVVAIPRSEVMTDSVSPYVVFNIHFQVGDVVHGVRERYSQLRAIHSQLQTATTCQLPSFPSASIFKDYTKSKNNMRRRAELLSYFNLLVQEPDLLRMPLFHKLFNFTEEAISALTAVAEQLVPQDQDTAGHKPVK